MSFQGETKRLKLTGDYQELISRVKECWAGIREPIKFFYLDEESEIISITSQSDFKEALEIEDLSSLKLTVATTVQDARQQLQSQIEDHQPLAESLSNANLFNQSRLMRADSAFESIGASELDRSSTINFMPKNKPTAQEMPCGRDAPVAMRGLDIGTDVNNLVARGDQGCNTVRVPTSEKMIDTCVETTASGTQARAATQDAANDGFAAETKAQGSQVAAVMDDEEELTSQEAAAVAETIRADVKEYCYSTFQGMFVDYLENKRIEQAGVVHENIICDGCEMTPIRGIRYMCSVRPNYDLCGQCEAKGVGSEHALLKIRKPEWAPAKLICQYGNAAAQNPFEMQLVQTQAQTDHPAPMQAPAKKQKAPRYQARFVKESIFDKHEVAPGVEFAKTWVFRNDGETSWPADVQLL